MKFSIELSLTPLLYPCRTLRTHHTTVVIDLLRATTAICAAFKAGCQYVAPLDSLDDIARYRELGFAIAAERGGSKVANAQFGNSPTEYLRTDMHGIRLAYSTTNGTRAIRLAAEADRVLVGAFSNITALCNKLRADAQNTVLLCAGWENDYCIEDTLVAGAVIERLADCATPLGDAANMALEMWRIAKANPLQYCQRCTHVARLQKLGAAADVEYAFQTDTCTVVPMLDGALLTTAQ